MHTSIIYINLQHYIQLINIYGQEDRELFLENLIFLYYRFEKYDFKFFVPKLLRVCGNPQFRLFEHFVEHQKPLIPCNVPNVRDFGLFMYSINSFISIRNTEC